MISITDLKSGATFKDKGQIFEVTEYSHKKMGRGSANIKIKAKNLRTGESVQKTYMSGAKVEEAEVSKIKLQFLYKDHESLIFMNSNTFEQFPIKSLLMGESAKLLKEGESYDVLVSENVVLVVQLPNLLAFKISETGPGVKGDTVSNVYKPATLENGMEIKVPMFIKNGDVVKIDTRTKEYVERVR